MNTKNVMIILMVFKEVHQKYIYLYISLECENKFELYILSRGKFLSKFSLDVETKFSQTFIMS